MAALTRRIGVQPAGRAEDRVVAQFVKLACSSSRRESLSSIWSIKTSRAWAGPHHEGAASSARRTFRLRNDLHEAKLLRSGRVLRNKSALRERFPPGRRSRVIRLFIRSVDRMLWLAHL